MLLPPPHIPRPPAFSPSPCTQGEGGGEGIFLHCGDNLAILPTLPVNSIDTIITDPPYGLEFMGKSWDCGVPGVPFWQAMLRVAKPGAFLLAFGGTRTFHRMTCAIEDAGWEIRDCMMWLYGSGFPKSLDISKAIDKAAGAEREVVGINEDYLRRKPNGMKTSGATAYQYSQQQQQTDATITAPSTDAAKLWSGWGTALKPAWEPIIIAMKPMEGTFAQNAQKYGVSGLNIDGGRIGTEVRHNKPVGAHRNAMMPYEGKIGPGTDVVGRFPANLILDESSAALLDEQTGKLTSGKPYGIKSGGQGNAFGKYSGGIPVTGFGDSGGASRFFYSSKASRSERNAGCEAMEEKPMNWSADEQNPGSFQSAGTHRAAQNNHPTVKPLALMQYLCTLTKTPTGGTVLDPFMGSGTTGIAARNTGRGFIGIELNPDYFKIAQSRISHSQEK